MSNEVATDISTEYKEESIFNLLSKYYGILFGIATIFITFAHIKKIGFVDPQYMAITPDKFISFANIVGECGVKIFFFMAGFGAYFSLNRNPDEWQFLIRKAKRMFPYYYTVLIILLFIYRPEIHAIFGNLFLVGYVLCLPHQFFWFHQAIYTMYLLAPVFFGILTKTESTRIRMIIIWLIFLFMGLSWYSSDVKNQMIHVIPLFVTGMLFCKLHLQNKPAIKHLVPAAYVGGIISFIILITKYRIIGPFETETPQTFPHLLIDVLMLAVCFFIVKFFNFLTINNKSNETLNSTLKIIGARALEIYIIQVILMDFIDYRSNARINLDFIYNLFPTDYKYAISCIIVILVLFISIFLGIIYGKLVDKYILRKKL